MGQLESADCIESPSLAHSHFANASLKALLQLERAGMHACKAPCTTLRRRKEESERLISLIQLGFVALDFGA